MKSGQFSVVDLGDEPSVPNPPPPSPPGPPSLLKQDGVTFISFHPSYPFLPLDPIACDQGANPKLRLS